MSMSIILNPVFVYTQHIFTLYVLLLGCSSPFQTPDGAILPPTTTLFLLFLHQGS